MPTIPEVLTLAWQRFQARDPRQAEHLCRQLLAQQPRLADGWYLLGLACQVQGKPADAAAGYRQALQLQPEHADAHNNLGVALQAQGRLAEATASFQQAVRQRPGSAELHNNLGLALLGLDRVDEAVASFHQAVRLQPGYAPAHVNLGDGLRKQNRFAEAAAAYQQVVRLQPGSAEAHNKLGLALAAQGQLDAALASFAQAVQLQPEFAEAHNNIGNVFSLRRQFGEAVTRYQQAVRIRPDYAQAHSNLGVSLRSLGRLDEAVASLQQALRLQPDNADAHSNLGIALAHQGRPAEARAAFEQALRLKPDFAAAHSNLLFLANYDPQAEPATLFIAHRRWEAQHGRVPVRRGHGNDRSPERRLRVGYVSPDLCKHPVAYFIEPVLAHHRPEQVEAICYAEVPFPDAVTARLRSLARGWRSTCGLTDAQVADLVTADGIDILVDLAGHSAGNRLRAFAHRPAPVQVTYLGYPNTTGLATVDYRLTDAVADPPGEPTWHTEELVRLPGVFCCYAPPADAPAVTPLPGARTGRLTFGSLHNVNKLNAPVLDLWCAILKAVPSARLLVYRHTLTGSARDYLARQLTERGIGPERFDLRHQAAGPGHLGVYGEVDVSLDVFPWSGHTTACESLWMGVPVLTLFGSRHAGRMAASLLTGLGLTDWIARTPEEYLARAVQIAGDLDRLALLRSSLRDRLRAAPLCDGPAFVRHLEDAHRWMWRHWCADPGGNHD
jgi:predicted O-linked N-acetylglucosamine transferase (SPINDLY family)